MVSEEPSFDFVEAVDEYVDGAGSSHRLLFRCVAVEAASALSSQALDGMGTITCG